MIRRFLRYGKDRPRITFTLAVILPGVFVSITEYILTNGISGEKPILASIAGGVFAVLVLRLFKPSEPPRRSERAQVPATPETREAFLKNLEGAVSTVLQVPAAPKTFTPSSLPNSPSEERIFSPRTPSELVDEVKGMTEVSAELFSKRHIGQWLKVDGPVEDIRREMRTICVHIMNTEPSFFLDFDEGCWSTRLASFNVGDHISAIGKIKYIGRGGYVSLEECELVS